MSKSIGSLFALGLATKNNEDEEEKRKRIEAALQAYTATTKGIDTENYFNRNNGYLNMNLLTDNALNYNHNIYQPAVFAENNTQYTQLSDNITGNTENQPDIESSTDEIFNRVFSRTMEEEGGFEFRSDKIDTPTNMGFQQATLDRFKEQHPEIADEFPEKIENLSYEQGRKIARKDYFDKYRIGEIKYKPLQETMFDSFFNHSPYAPALWAQKAINQNVNTYVDEDGIFGSQTINALNNLSEDDMIKVNNAIIDQREEDYEEEKKRNRNRFYRNYTRGLKNRFNRFRLR